MSPLEQEARQRVQDNHRLYAERDVLFVPCDTEEDDEHWWWLAKAPEPDILEYVRKTREQH